MLANVGPLMHRKGDRYLKSTEDEPEKQSRAHVSRFPAGYSDPWGRSSGGRCHSQHTDWATAFLHSTALFPYTTSIFNQLRSWCIFQDWEVLDGNFPSTAVKAVPQWITQRVVQSQGLVFTSLLLMHAGTHTHTHERVKIRAASSTMNTQRGRREKWRCTCIIHGICRKMKWTSFGKLGTFCSNASRPPRGANYYTLPSVQGQNNQNSHSMTSTARKRSTVGFPSG